MKALIGVDLAETLRSIVKLKVNNYQTDIVYDVLDLSKSKVNDYFCFMTRDSGTWLFSQKQVYIKDTQANITWKNYKDQDVSTYAIEITDRQDNKVIGNIYEIDYKKTLDDVIKNEKEVEKVEVTFLNDTKIVYDVDDFKNNKNDIVNKYGEIKEAKDLIKDYFLFNIHMSKVKSQIQNSSKAISVNEYLESMNSEKLNKLGYKKNDMYYIGSSDCEKVLDQSNINVYLLQGNGKIRIDRPVSDYENPVYGIWIEDKKRFDIFDRKELNFLIRSHVSDRIKRDKLRELGYKDNNLYLLDSNKEIESAFNKNLDIYSLDKDLNKKVLKDFKDISENLEQGKTIVIDKSDKDKMIGALLKANNANYIDILNKRELETIINLQINEATYFDRIKEEEGQYLVENIDSMAEKLIEDYDVDTNISEKVGNIIKDKLKSRDRGSVKKDLSFKDRIEKAKEKSKENSKNKSEKQNGIER